MRALFFLILIFIGLTGYGQEHTILSKFTAHYTGSEVVLAWTIKGGEQCNGINIYRSTDSVNWVKIGEIQGVCGASEPQFYDFNDVEPELGNINYYRLSLGTQGFSSIQYVQVIRYENSYAAFPNPSNNQMTFSVSPELGYGTLNVFSLSGDLVYQYEMFEEETLVLSKDVIGEGYFLFKWINDEIVVSGKLVFE